MPVTALKQEETASLSPASPLPRAVPPPVKNLYVKSLIAAELSTFTRYYDRLIQWHPQPGDRGSVLGLADCKRKELVGDAQPMPDLREERESRSVVLLNGNLNHHFDIEGLLKAMRKGLSRTTRVAAVLYNPYLSWVFTLASRMGQREGAQPTTFVTYTDLANIAKLSGYEIVRSRPVAYCPWRLLGLGAFINKVMPILPLFKHLGLASVVTLRPVFPENEAEMPTISIVIPARNERGNIENAVKRLRESGIPLQKIEVIFVEGHSSDGTWAEIERVTAQYLDLFPIQKLRQTGKGKADAVRLGFANASGELLTILDADLTMPPELLGRFYDAYCRGLADFVNGTRLVYPMEGEAMRFLNRLGNVFFSKALSSVLDARLGDTLCGTKLVTRHDYQRMIAWRKDFGDFDPFGDFELLFPATSLALGIVDIPIRYLARTYGTTNISRFRHGLLLLRMTLIGLLKIRSGREARPARSGP